MQATNSPAMHGMIPHGEAVARYQEIDLASRIVGADPVALVALLYDELLLALDALEAGVRCRNAVVQQAQSKRAQAILAGLIGSLDHERGGQVSEILASVYHGMLGALGRIHTPEDFGQLAELRQSVVEMVNMWGQLRATGLASGASPDR